MLSNGDSCRHNETGIDCDNGRPMDIGEPASAQRMREQQRHRHGQQQWQRQRSRQTTAAATARARAAAAATAQAVTFTAAAAAAATPATLTSTTRQRHPHPYLESMLLNARAVAGYYVESQPASGECYVVCAGASTCTQFKGAPVL